MRPRIEAVTVCVGYDDFLAETIKTNRQFFDRWIIVTDTKDAATADVCHQHNLELIQTDEFYEDGDSFNKGRGIERGLTMLAHRNWLMHIDADIALPRDFLESLEDARPKTDHIYGADRFMLKSWEEWQDFKPRHARAYHCYVPMSKPIGARWADHRHGYVPIGFFQLWHESADHRKGVRLRRYPDTHQDAARADVKFALQWDRQQRELIPELVVAHLESGPAPMGANWKGRKTKRFGPPAKPSGGCEVPS